MIFSNRINDTSIAIKEKQMTLRKYHLQFLILLIALILTACGVTEMGDGEALDQPGNQKIKVVATTTIVGDVVAQVGGDAILLSVLLPVGSDPHTFDPTPQDVVTVAEADIVFANGVGLEAFLDPLLESAGATDRVVSVSEGIELIHPSEEHEHESAAEEHEHESAAEEQDGADPHVWTDPNNITVWVQNIQTELIELDPAKADIYQANADQYERKLQELDSWVRGQVAQIPEANRKFVTDHTLFSYFSAEYGIKQIGAIITGYSTMAEPSAQELAQLEDAIQNLKVSTIFVGNTINPSLAERVSEDTNTQLVFIYTGSLSDNGGPADSYLDYIRYNVSTIVDALK
jgi:ABC-type Zn uptake system ZnuABC Zn-binding protein ZnuA